MKNISVKLFAIALVTSIINQELNARHYDVYYDGDYNDYYYERPYGPVEGTASFAGDVVHDTGEFAGDVVEGATDVVRGILP